MAKAKNYRENGDKPEKFAPIAIDSKERASAIENAERVVIFSIDGRDYDMPKATRAELAVRFMELAEEDANEAGAYLLRETIGQEAIDALKGVKGLTEKDFEGVMVRVQSIALPKGKRPTAAKH